MTNLREILMFHRLALNKTEITTINQCEQNTVATRYSSQITVACNGSCQRMYRTSSLQSACSPTSATEPVDKRYRFD